MALAQQPASQPNDLPPGFPCSQGERLCDERVGAQLRAAKELGLSNQDPDLIASMELDCVTCPRREQLVLLQQQQLQAARPPLEKAAEALGIEPTAIFQEPLGPNRTLWQSSDGALYILDHANETDDTGLHIHAPKNVRRSLVGQNEQHHGLRISLHEINVPIRVGNVTVENIEYALVIEPHNRGTIEDVNNFIRGLTPDRLIALFGLAIALAQNYSYPWSRLGKEQQVIATTSRIRDLVQKQAIGNGGVH